MMVRKLKESSNNTSKRLQDLEKKFVQNPQNIDELTKLQSFVSEELPMVLEEIKAENFEMGRIYELLEEQNFKLPKTQLEKRWELVRGPKLIMELIK